MMRSTTAKLALTMVGGYAVVAALVAARESARRHGAVGTGTPPSPVGAADVPASVIAGRASGALVLYALGNERPDGI